MAFLGASFRFWAAAPPNQPHILSELWKGLVELQRDDGGDERALSSGRGYRNQAKWWKRMKAGIPGMTEVIAWSADGKMSGWCRCGEGLIRMRMHAREPRD